LQQGGRGLDERALHLLHRELALAGVVYVPDLGARVIGPSLLSSGSAADRTRWLPLIASGAEHLEAAIWEPLDRDGPGLKLNADPAGSAWRLSGQRFVRRSAHMPDHLLCFVRTGEGMLRHCVTALVITAEEVSFADYDDCRWLVDIDDLLVRDQLGGRNEGWTFLEACLIDEFSVVGSTAQLQHMVHTVKSSMRDDEDYEEGIEKNLADVEVSVAALEAMEMRTVDSALHGQPDLALQAAIRLLVPDLVQRIAYINLRVDAYRSIPAVDMLLSDNEPGYGSPRGWGMLTGSIAQVEDFALKDRLALNVSGQVAGLFERLSAWGDQTNPENTEC
jgi:alkylation response protein AidB-like acyl-CoA dehydrogenase